MERDHVDHILEEWERERPDLDLSGMAVIARISRASRILERNSQSVLCRYGINEPMFGVLAALMRAGPPYRRSPSALRRSLLISSGAMTRRLDRLTAAGLVTRTRGAKDRRSMPAALSPQGIRLMSEAVTAHSENQLRRLEPLCAYEREQLANLLRKFLLTVADDAEANKTELEVAKPTPDRAVTVHSSQALNVCRSA